MAPPEQYVLASEIMLSPKSGLINVQLAGEMVAAEAALNIWFVEIALRTMSGAERDRSNDPIDELWRKCRAVWGRHRAEGGFSAKAWVSELESAQADLVAAIWRILPPGYRPHPSPASRLMITSERRPRRRARLGASIGAKRASPVAGDLDLDRADLGGHRLRGRTR